MKLRLLIITVLIGVLLSGLALTDEGVAKVYLQKALDFIKQKNHLSALESFEKASQEAPNMPEIYFERGMMYWKIKEMTEGIKDLEKAQTLINELNKPTMDQKSMLSKIKSNQAEHFKLTDEYSALNQKYSERFLKLMEQNMSEGNPYLISIADWTEPIMSGNLKEQYYDLRKSIFKGVRSKMTPLFNGENFDDWESNYKDWTVEEGKALCQHLRSVSIMKHKTQLSSDSFLIAANVQIVETEESSTAAAGIVFGGRFDQLMVFALRNNRVELIHFTIQTNPETNRQIFAPQVLDNNVVPSNFNARQPNEMLVFIDGNYVTCYLNGKLMMQRALTGKTQVDGKSFYGAPGLFVQFAAAQFSDFACIPER